MHCTATCRFINFNPSGAKAANSPYMGDKEWIHIDKRCIWWTDIEIGLRLVRCACGVSGERCMCPCGVWSETTTSSCYDHSYAIAGGHNGKLVFMMQTTTISWQCCESLSLLMSTYKGTSWCDGITVSFPKQRTDLFFGMP